MVRRISWRHVKVLQRKRGTKQLQYTTERRETTKDKEEERGKKKEHRRREMRKRFNPRTQLIIKKSTPGDTARPQTTEKVNERSNEVGVHQFPCLLSFLHSSRVGQKAGQPFEQLHPGFLASCYCCCISGVSSALWLAS